MSIWITFINCYEYDCLISHDKKRMTFYFQLLTAILLDAFIGDPEWYPHPVRGIGAICNLSESLTRRINADLFFAGLLTVVLVLGFTGAIVSLILFVAATISSTLGGIVGVVLLYTTIAAKDLFRHSMEVYSALENKANLANARLAVGKIVGRDTGSLDEKGVCKAAVETVAENMVDGITAPLFFGILASCFAPTFNISPISCTVLGAFLYKAVNTMDSMIGYKNDTYLIFGRAAAKLDDAVNCIPARLSGICLIIAAFLLKLDYKKAAEIFLRDRLQHSSPNAGHTEAVTAGALGIQLGGPSVYFNTIVVKPFIGDRTREAVPADIKATNHLVVVGSILFVGILVSLRMVYIP